MPVTRIRIEATLHTLSAVLASRATVDHDLVVVGATDASELPRLDELERRGIANGVPGLRRLGPGELREVEPHCAGVAALHSPATGIVDFADVARALATELEENGTPVVTGCGVDAVGPRPGRVG